MTWTRRVLETLGVVIVATGLIAGSVFGGIELIASQTMPLMPPVRFFLLAIIASALYTVMIGVVMFYAYSHRNVWVSEVVAQLIAPSIICLLYGWQLVPLLAAGILWWIVAVSTCARIRHHMVQRQLVEVFLDSELDDELPESSARPLLGPATRIANFWNRHSFTAGVVTIAVIIAWGLYFLHGTTWVIPYTLLWIVAVCYVIVVVAIYAFTKNVQASDEARRTCDTQ